MIAPIDQLSDGTENSLSKRKLRGVILVAVDAGMDVLAHFRLLTISGIGMKSRTSLARAHAAIKSSQWLMSWKRARRRRAVDRQVVDFIHDQGPGMSEGFGSKASKHDRERS